MARTLGVGRRGDMAGRGGDSRKSMKQVWKQVRAPFAAIVVTLARVGWQFMGPFSTRDAQGAEHRLTLVAPSMLTDCVVRDPRKGRGDEC